MYNNTNSTEGVFGDAILSNYSQFIIASFLILMTVTGIVGNSSTIFSVFLSTKLQTKTNVFLVNLACCDLITCFFAPMQVVALLTPYEPSVPGKSSRCLWNVPHHFGIYQYLDLDNDCNNEVCQDYQNRKYIYKAFHKAENNTHYYRYLGLSWSNKILCHFIL